jgi:hypothetical protein
MFSGMNLSGTGLSTYLIASSLVCAVATLALRLMGSKLLFSAAAFALTSLRVWTSAEEILASLALLLEVDRGVVGWCGFIEVVGFRPREARSLALFLGDQGQIVATRER